MNKICLRVMEIAHELVIHSWTFKLLLCVCEESLNMAASATNNH